MAMTLQNNLNALSAINRLLVSSNQMGRAAESVASGSRINRAADDAAGLAVSMKMQSQIGGTEQAIRNALDGVSMIQTAEGALDGTHAMLSRVKMLSVQSANGIYSNEQRGFIQMEIDQTMSEINRIAATTNFNGINLLDGSLSGDNGLILQIGANNAAEQRFTVSINSMSARALGVSGVNVGSAQNAFSAIDSADGAIGLVSGQRANLGAMQNRLEHTVSSLVNTSENLVAANSRISDADMVEAMMNYTKNNILRQSAIAMLAHTMKEPQGMLQLLGSPAMNSFRV
jgi:flagellin